MTPAVASVAVPRHISGRSALQVIAHRLSDIDAWACSSCMGLVNSKTYFLAVFLLPCVPGVRKRKRNRNEKNAKGPAGRLITVSLVMHQDGRLC
jgi:hypothetical protein